MKTVGQGSANWSVLNLCQCLFCELNVIGTQPYKFIYVLFITAELSNFEKILKYLIPAL